MAICGCKGCDLPVLALGMCNKHWRRTKLYGSPFVLMSRSHLLRGLSAEERFKRQHKKSDACWLWTGACDRDGYGVMRATIHGQHLKKAHRFSWALHNKQPIPKGMVVCHTCDNPRCVNPSHLWLGTAAENQMDRVKKGRVARMRGELNHSAVLTESQVRAILADARPYSQIAADYDVTTMTVSDIKCRRSWGHLDVEYIGRAPRVSPHKGIGNKINAEIVQAIRASDEPGTVLAERYGVSRSLISNILKRRVWAHVKES